MSAITGRAEKINLAKEKCKWTDEQTNRIIRREYKEPTEEYCQDLSIKTEAMEVTAATSETQFQTMFQVKNSEISQINFQLLQLETFREDIKHEFETLNSKEEEELIKLAETSEVERLQNIKDYKKADSELNKFIISTAELNKQMENRIKTMMNDVDEKLTENNDIKLNVEKNRSLKEPGLDGIIDGNQIIIDNKLSTYWKLFYGTAFSILIMLFVILFMGYKTYHKFMN
jgi:hypothetical protein